MTTNKNRGEVRNSRLSKVAADLFLKHGYEGVSIDKIVGLAGGSKSTVYTEFGGKCGLFISSIEKLCREINEPLGTIDYTALDLEASLKKLGLAILKLITSKRSVDLHRLSIAEAANCPEVGEAWYTHGPARTASFIRAVLERHRDELPSESMSLDAMAVIFHDALSGDVLYRRLSGVSKREGDDELLRRVTDVVDLVLKDARETNTLNDENRRAVKRRA